MRSSATFSFVVNSKRPNSLHSSVSSKKEWKRTRGRSCRSATTSSMRRPIHFSRRLPASFRASLAPTPEAVRRSSSLGAPRGGQCGAPPTRPLDRIWIALDGDLLTSPGPSFSPGGSGRFGRYAHSLNFQLKSALRFLWRQLVGQLWPLAFHHRPHFIGDGVHALDIEHVLMQPFQVGRHHHLAADKTGFVDAAFFSHWRLLSALGVAVLTGPRVHSKRACSIGSLRAFWGSCA